MATKAQQQRRNSSKGKLRRTNFKKLYNGKHPDYDLDEQEIRVSALVGSGGRGNFMRLDLLAESVTWEDAGVPMTGTVALKNPDDPSGELLVNRTRLGHGTVIKCDLARGGAFKELWRMRVWDPESSLEEDSFTFPLYDDLKFLRESRDDFIFRANKKRRKKGWRADQILREVARRYKIPLGKIAKGKHYIKKLEMRNVSPIDVIIKAYRLERQATGRRFVLSWRRGGLHVVPLARGQVMYKFGPHIMGGTVTMKRPKGFCTALTARCTTGKGRNKKKIVVKVKSKKGVKKFGYIHRQINIPDCETKAELKRKAIRELSDRMHIKEKVSFSHPDVAVLRRGDIIDFQGMQDHGLTGKRDRTTGQHDDIAWVSRVSHTWTGGTYTAEVETGIKDPFRDYFEKLRERDEKERDKKRKKKKAKS